MWRRLAPLVAVRARQHRDDPLFTYVDIGIFAIHHGIAHFDFQDVGTGRHLHDLRLMAGFFGLTGLNTVDEKQRPYGRAGDNEFRGGAARQVSCRETSCSRSAERQRQ